MKSGKTIIPFMEANYHKFTPLEKTIADFFLHNKEETDFSSKAIANKLFVSEASLSRFSKKCGFSGYREFIFHYQEQWQKKQVNVEGNTQRTLNAYQELLEKTYGMINEAQIKRVAKYFSQYDRVIAGGMGSSAYAAAEMELRFMRVGVNIHSIGDSHRLRMQSVFHDTNCLVFGLSLSGTTEDVLFMLKNSHENGAKTILMTASNREDFISYCDEIIFIPSLRHMDSGNVISPQLPFLIYQDILYAHYLETNQYQKETYHDNTLRALHPEKKLF